MCIRDSTYTFKNGIENLSCDLKFIECNKLLGTGYHIQPIINDEEYTGKYIDMVNYQQVILRCPSLQFEDLTQDNINDKDSIINVSDILFWINKQDVEPFKTISYNNEDGCTSYSYNIKNENIRTLNFKLYNENNEIIQDANDYLLQLKLTIYDKDENIYKDMGKRIISLLDDIYYLLLNAFFKKNVI